VPDFLPGWQIVRKRRPQGADISSSEKHEIFFKNNNLSPERSDQNGTSAFLDFWNARFATLFLHLNMHRGGQIVLM